MFSGIGGFSVAANKLGYETKAFCEIDPYAKAVLHKHWPEVPIYDDITTTDFRQVEPVELVTAGFPCQDLSKAGYGTGLQGERSSLFWYILRAASLVGRPRMLLENVAALRTRGLHTVLGALASFRYDAEWHCVPATYVGAPHRRDRMWIVADPIRSERRQEPYRRALGRMGRVEQSFPWDRGWKEALREFRGMDDGLSYRVHRIDTIRNAIVPQVAEVILDAVMSTESN